MQSHFGKWTDKPGPWQQLWWATPQQEGWSWRGCLPRCSKTKAFAVSVLGLQWPTSQTMLMVTRGGCEPKCLYSSGKDIFDLTGAKSRGNVNVKIPGTWSLLLISPMGFYKAQISTSAGNSRNGLHKKHYTPLSFQPPFSFLAPLPPPHPTFSLLANGHMWKEQLYRESAAEHWHLAESISLPGKQLPHQALT